MNIKKYSCLLVIIFNYNLNATFNRSLFYRVSSFYDEPRFQKDFLTTTQIEISGGTADICTKDICTKDICAKDIYSKNKKFKLLQADFNIYQNFLRGFFLHFHLPVESTEIINKKNKKREYGLSDSTLFLGYTHNHENTTHLDYVDLTIKTGVLFPTGKTVTNLSTDNIPYGYNGHWGIPISADTSIGAYDWLTFGGHIDILALFSKSQNLKFENYKFKNICTKIKPGTVFRIGTYFKADHLILGMSWLFGVTYEQQTKTQAKTETREIKDYLYFKNWHRTILHFLFEYDHTNCQKDQSINIGLIYNVQVEGKNVFKTNMLAGYLALNFGWHF